MASSQKDATPLGVMSNSEMVLNPGLNSVENHLQSLGFVINNGEARFKLDDTNAGGNTDFSIVDAEDTASFVVLGRDSMESIQASSMASYMDIQQKGVSVDYSSIITSLDSSEIHEKLAELLQENGRLKEALKQNNMAMKDQITTLASWQEEMMKVHQNHKKKFVETTELIKYLKKENCELKMKLSMDQFDNPDTGFNIIEVNGSGDKEDLESSRSEGIQQKISSLEDGVSTSQLKREELSTQVEKLMTLSNVFNSEMNQTTSMKSQENLDAPMNELNPGQSQDQYWMDYMRRLQKSKEFFQFTKNRCYNIAKNLEDTIKILDEKLGKNETNIDVKSYVQVLSGNYDKHQQISVTADLQNRLEGILSEYESVLSNFTTKVREYTPKKTSVWETVQSTENSGVDEKRLLEEERAKLSSERESLEEEKKVLINQKKSFETAQKSLNEAREFLEQKIISLNQEKTSLDQQSQLFEDFEKALQAEKKSLTIKCDKLTREADSLKATLAEKDDEIKAFQEKIKEQAEEIYSLEVQMKMYEEDFTQERKIKDTLLADHNKVVADLMSQMEFRKQLQNEIACLKGKEPNSQSAGQSGAQSPKIQSFVCPNCQCAFTDFDILQDHVMTCLNLS